MNKIQHTEGPWEIVHRREEYIAGAAVGPYWIKILIGTPKPTGQPDSVITGEFVAWIQVPMADEAKAEANAALIAAAPDLLAACKKWDEGFADGESFTSERFLRWVNVNRAAARSAIAKATSIKAQNRGTE